MNGIFLATIIVMVLIAFAFLLQPLARVSANFGQRFSRFSLSALFLLPALAIGLYAFFGTPDAALADRQLSGATQSTVQTTRAPGKKLGSVASMVTGLAERVRRDPNDAGSWLLLAKSYRHLGKADAAANAYARAVALGKSDADMETFLAAHTSSGSGPGQPHGWESVAVEFAERIDEEI
jgi:cytochrome c-type biogenesis protein CcmH